MNSVADQRLRGIAERVVWFQLPEHTLARPGAVSGACDAVWQPWRCDDGE